MLFLRIFVGLVFVLYTATTSAQQPLTGDYTGTLGPIHLIVHLKQTEAGTLAATLDSPDQGATGIPAETVTLAAGNLSVAFHSLHATYIASRSTDGRTLTGTWTQSASTPLVLHVQEPFVSAATPSPIDGDWTGTLATAASPLILLLHIKSDRHGTEYLTFDSPAQHANGLIADHVAFTRKDGSQQLSFDLVAVHGHYTGQLSSDCTSLAGAWTQGGTAPLTFTRVPVFVPAAKPSLADGEWAGTLTTPKGDLHTLLHVRSDRTGTEYITLDSPDQLATGYEATHASLAGRTLNFDLPQLHATFSGSVAPTNLDGTWTQTIPMPIHLTRLPATAPAQAGPQPTPLPLTALPAHLDAELKPLLENPALAGSSNIGLAIGLVSHGERRILTYGTATPTSVFEIGSLTKTFTSLLLAQAVAAGTLQLDTPVRTLLPPNTILDPNSPEITLLSLAIHHSGLPRLPDNLHPANPLNPYAGYTLANLYTFLATHGTARPASDSYLYSNVGAALLGQALAADAALPYEALLRRGILTPLHLTHTSLTAPPMPGHTEDDQPTPAWDLNAFAPAGGLHSDVLDMVTYTEAQLHPPPAFAAAIALQHQIQADTSTGKIALAWFFDPATGDFSHDGATGGFSSFIFFNPQQDLAAVVLINRASDLANSLGQQIAALLEGRAPTPLRR